MTYWRSAGLNYIKFSNIVAKVVRRSLKDEYKAEALKRDDSSVKFTNWKNGKPVKAESAAN